MVQVNTLAEIQAQMAEAERLEGEERVLDAIQVYTTVVSAYAAESDEKIRTFVAQALFHQAMLFNEMEHFEKELASLLRIEQIFADAKTIPLLDVVSDSMMHRAYTLAELGRISEAKAVYEDVIVQFSRAAGEIFAERVEKAREEIDELS